MLFAGEVLGHPDKTAFSAETWNRAIDPGRTSLMWRGMDPKVWKELESVREMVKLSHQSPTKEWPLVFVEEFDELLVVREWPGGNVTAYTMSKADNTAGD